MEVDKDYDSYYRIQLHSQVKYVTIAPEAFEHDVRRYPPILLPTLYPLPDGDWISMTIRRGPNGENSQTFDHTPLPAVEATWHPTLVDVLSLRGTGFRRFRVFEVEYNGKPAVAKIARFDWEIRYIRTETIAYSRLAGKDVAPTFLAHLTEQGRVMGILVEKVEGRNAEIADLDTCRALVKRVHAEGIVHGDLNKFNFLVGDGRMCLIDFENASEYDSESAIREINQLQAQLEEETGRGSLQPITVTEKD